MIAPSAGGRHPSISPWSSRRLWSLWEMLKISASAYLSLGGRLEQAVTDLFASEDITKSPYGTPLSEDKTGSLSDVMRDILNECEKLQLPISSEVFRSRIASNSVPYSSSEMNLLIEVIQSELRTQLFLFVPTDKAKFYQSTLPSSILAAFPTASQDLILAGNAIAADLFTASVIHSMRACEIGVRVMGRALKVSFSYPIELAEWGKIVGGIEQKISAMKAGARSSRKDKNLQFYSEAAAQFRHFNNAWRVRCAHARATYDEAQAIAVYDHALSFFQTLAIRLKE